MKCNPTYRWPTASKAAGGDPDLQGFTLTEVMVSLFILVASITTASLFFASMARAARFTDSAIAATALAQAKMEELLEQTYPSMFSGEDALAPYHRTWTVRRTNAVAYLGVNVAWEELDGHTRTMTLNTMRSP